MADSDSELRLGFSADLSQLESASRSLRSYIQATVDAVKAETDMNAASLQLASSQGIVAESIRDSFSNSSTSKLNEFAQNTDKVTESMNSLRESIQGVKEQAQDPSLEEALGNIGNGGGEGGGNLNRRTINDVARGVGLVSPGAGEAVRVGNDVKEFSEALPKLKEALSNVSTETLALGGATLTLVALYTALHNQFEQGKKDAEGEIDARTKALTLIQQGTQADIQARIEELQRQKETNQKLADDAKQLNQDLLVNSDQAFGAFRTGVGQLSDSLGIGSGKFAAAQENVDKTNKALEGTNTELDLLTQYANSGAKSEADLAAAAHEAQIQTEALAETLFKYAQDAIGKAVDAQIQIGDLIKHGSEAQLDDAIAAAQKNVTATKLKIDAEYAYAATLDPLSKQYTEVSHTISDLQAQQTEYQKTLDTLSSSTVRAYTVANDAAAKQAEIQSKQADSYAKYLDNREKADSDYQTAQTNAYTKYTDTLQNIADSAVKAAQQALEKLEEKRSDLATKFAQTETDDATKFHDQQLDDQIKYQREQVQLTQDHQRNLKKIIEDAANQEKDLILNRDFAGLFNLRQQTQTRINDENESYTTQQQQRQQAFKDQEDDESRHFAAQEQQASVNYQRELQQAQLAYTREQQQAERNRQDALNKAQASYNQELSQLSSKYQAQLQLAHDAEVQELNIIAMGSEQKLAIEKDFANQAVAFWKGALSQLSNGNALGAISGSNSSIPGASNRNGGASGNAVTNNNGNMVGAFNLTQNISGRDEQRIAEIAAQQTQRILADFIK